MTSPASLSSHPSKINKGLKKLQLPQVGICCDNAVINRFFMKLFRTSNIETVSYSHEYFGSTLPSTAMGQAYSVFKKLLPFVVNKDV